MMVDEIKEFSIPATIADEIEEFVCKSETIDFKLINYTISDSLKIDMGEKFGINPNEIDGITIKDSFYFCKVMCNLQVDKSTKQTIYKIDEFTTNKIKPLQDFIALNVLQEPVYVVLARINCFVKMYDDYAITYPHTDMGDFYLENPNRISVLYYVNDSCGETHFFDTNTKKLIKKIPPKRGTGVVFNPTIIHAAQYPRTKDSRFVIYFLFGKDAIVYDKAI
jgi:hypothetical protein